MQYVDASAFVKRYVREADSSTAQRLLLADPQWVTAAHTEVEVRRTLTARLAATPKALAQAREAFRSDWLRTYIVALDHVTCQRAAEYAETTGARSLDALHLAAAQRAGAPAVRVVVFDARMAQIVRSLGWTAVGA